MISSDDTIENSIKTDQFGQLKISRDYPIPTNHWATDCDGLGWWCQQRGGSRRMRWRMLLQRERGSNLWGYNDGGGWGKGKRDKQSREGRIILEWGEEQEVRKSRSISTLLTSLMTKLLLGSSSSSEPTERGKKSDHSAKKTPSIRHLQYKLKLNPVWHHTLHQTWQLVELCLLQRIFQKDWIFINLFSFSAVHRPSWQLNLYITHLLKFCVVGGLTVTGGWAYAWTAKKGTEAFIYGNTSGSAHLVLQVILPVHLMMGDVKVIVGVVVLKHTAEGAETNKSITLHINNVLLRKNWGTTRCV